MSTKRQQALSVALMLLLCTIPISSGATTLENHYDNLSLRLGETMVLRFTQPAAGAVTYSITELPGTSRFVVMQMLLLHQETEEVEPTVVHSGVLDAPVVETRVENLPAGEVYLIIHLDTPDYGGVEADPEGFANDSFSASFTISFGPGLTINPDYPPLLELIQPSEGTQIWGADREVLFAVKTHPYFPVFFDGSDLPVVADSKGEASKLVKLSGDLVEVLQALTIGSTGHMKSTSVTVIRHWILTDPRVKPTLSRSPAIAVTVPDASLVNLEHSIMEVAGEAMPLYANLASNVIYGVPRQSLATGPLPVELILVGKPNKNSNEIALLDFASWTHEVVGNRVAELWDAKLEAIINGERFILEAAPFIDKASNSTMLPFRFIGDIMGAHVGWNSTSRKATFRLEDKTVELTIGHRTAYVNGKPVLMPTAPRLVDGRTMVPLRFVSENLGAKVGWSSSQRKITIRVQEAPLR